MKIFRKKRKDNFKEEFRFKGHRFYMPINPDVLEGTRAIAFWSSVREFTLKITASDLDVMQKRMKEAINKSDLATLGYLVSTMEAYRQIEASERTLLNAGQQFIFIDDEKNAALTDGNKALKERLFYDHPEVKAFFLSNMWFLISSLLNLSEDTEIEDFSIPKEAQQVERIFSNLIAGNGI